MPNNNIREKVKIKHLTEIQATCYMNPEEEAVESNWNLLREERPCKGRKCTEHALLSSFGGQLLIQSA